MEKNIEFEDYELGGSEINFSLEGVNFRAVIIEDNISSLRDFKERYSDEEKLSWVNDNWEFVIIKLECLFGFGLTIDVGCYPGVEMNLHANNQNMNNVCYEFAQSWLDNDGYFTAVSQLKNHIRLIDAARALPRN